MACYQDGSLRDSSLSILKWPISVLLSGGHCSLWLLYSTRANIMYDVCLYLNILAASIVIVTSLEADISTVPYHSIKPTD